ncbi:MAG TPA: hypothetical protein VMB35_08695 [Methanomicrobiales archaeon]|nr:hypothetical protein [Methanomicrobiales archaeon]
MATDFENMATLLLVVLTIAVIVEVVLTGLLFWYLKRILDMLAGRGSQAPAVPSLPLPPPAIGSRITPLPKPEEVREAVAVPVPVREAPPVEIPAPAPAPAPARPAPPARAPAKPAPPSPEAAPVVEILKDSPDIQGSIHRLCEKYGLSDFIIATLDGLVVVSLFPGASEEAARFSDLYRRRKKPDITGVTFIGISHHGEDMLGIARSNHPLSPEERKGIDEDARRILSWWL